MREGMIIVQEEHGYPLIPCKKHLPTARIEGNDRGAIVTCR